MSNLRQRLLGLATTIAILGLVVGTPVLFVSIGAVPTLHGFGWTRLTGPDDGSLALAVIGVVAWLAWLVLTVSLAIEAVARLRGIHAPTFPGLAVPQLAAGRLIATASLLFVTLPIGTHSLPPPRAAAHQVPTALVHEPGPVSATETFDPINNASAPGAERGHKPVVRYTVRRGDSLWKIAQERLGDGTRYTEIVDLNPDLLGGRPDFITPGLVLLLPDEPTRTPEEPQDREVYVVEPGDTLSQVAEETLGDDSRYPEIFEASQHTRQIDGEHLRDPDLIQPGWRLTIPDGQPTRPPAPTAHREAPHQINPPADHSHRPADPTPGPTRPTRPAAEPPVDASQDPRPDAAANGSGGHEPQRDDTGNPGWVLPGLTASGALLAGALLLTLRRQRRTQLRYRRPGHVITPPPAQLHPVEKTAHLTGTTTAPQIEVLDAVLRALENPPALDTVELRDDQITLHLADHAQLPTPWVGSGTRWTLPTHETAASTDADRPAPYPLLVSVGQDPHGHFWLLNLEQHGSVSITGDGTKAEELTRHIAAELVLNPWASLVDVDLLGLAPELAPIDPLRLHHHDHADPTFLDRLAEDLQPDDRWDQAQPEGFRVLIAAAQHADAEPVRKVVQIITDHPGRPGAAIVTLYTDPAPDQLVLTLAPGGRLVSEAIGLDVLASGLTTQEAAACAAIMEMTRDAEISPTPPGDHTHNERAALSDASGALRNELTSPRPAAAAGDGSLLPLASEEYEVAAATTAEDVATLAPLVPPETRHRVEAADPTLDEDLQLWRDADSPLPRLTLLGPVTARANGNAVAVARRKPFYVELLSFLALHPLGVTSDEVATAFRLSTARVAVDMKAVRSWLGVNPRTGTDHLPHAKKSRAFKTRGTPAYQVDDVLIDWDLFRRLRARGQARGAEGINDLSAALELVTGEPFTHLRPAGWSWLLDGDRHDHIAMCAIVDVAHIVISQALATGELDRARAAAHTSYRAAPDDETSRLDLIQVAAASGHTELAERQLIDAIFDRSDDDLGPVELPERTARIVRQHGWNQRRHTSNH